MQPHDELHTATHAQRLSKQRGAVLRRLLWLEVCLLSVLWLYCGACCGWLEVCLLRHAATSGAGGLR